MKPSLTFLAALLLAPVAAEPVAVPQKPNILIIFTGN